MGVSVSGLTRLLRPRQWVKNAFVFAPLVFSGSFLSSDAVLGSAVAFLYFCLAASASYVLNDLRDVESDRRHPVKSVVRPLAAGTVTVNQARLLMGLLYAGALSAWLHDPRLALVLTAYLLLNVAYSWHLKHKPVADIFAVALGFVLRVHAGSVALSLPSSSWMLITTLSLALFLAAIKRRMELKNSGSEARPLLGEYTERLVERYAEMSATCAVLFYSLFVLSDRQELAVTIPFVIYGLFRYWFITESKGLGESPTDALFLDAQLQACVVAWIGICAYMIGQ